MSSKGFETTIIDVIEFHHQVSIRVTNILTILEFYMLIYKDLKMFYWIITMVFRVKSFSGISQTPTLRLCHTVLGVPMINSFPEAPGYSGSLLYLESRISQQSFPSVSSHTHSTQFFPPSLTETICKTQPHISFISFLCPQCTPYICNHSFSAFFLLNIELLLILIINNILICVGVCVCIGVSMAQRTLTSNIFQCFPQSHITLQQRKQ